MTRTFTVRVPEDQLAELHALAASAGFGPMSDDAFIEHLLGIGMVYERRTLKMMAAMADEPQRELTQE